MKYFVVYAADKASLIVLRIPLVNGEVKETMEVLGWVSAIETFTGYGSSFVRRVCDQSNQLKSARPHRPTSSPRRRGSLPFLHLAALHEVQRLDYPNVSAKTYPRHTVDVLPACSSRANGPMKWAGFGVVGPTLWSPLPSDNTMSRLFSKKPKKPLKSSQRHISLGIPTNIAAGPLGFRAELAVDSEGQQSRSCHDLEVDGPDLIAILDENDAKGSRIVLHDKMSGDQGSAVTDVLATGFVVKSNEQGGDPTSKDF